MTPDGAALISSRSGRAAVIVAALVAGMMSITLTLSNVALAQAPSTALQAWPWSSAARAATAAVLVADPRGVSRATAMTSAAEARAALGRSTVNAVAARSYAAAQLVQGNEAAAARAFGFAEYLTRRDLPTQFYLIEVAVARGDVAGALVHYDRALRVSVKAQATLFPILVGAAEQPEIRPALAAMLARRPSWWAPFISQEIGQAATPEALLPLIVAVRLKPDDPTGSQLIVATLDRLLRWGQLDAAWRMQRHWLPARNGAARVSFDDAGRLGPFAWYLAKQDDLNAIIDRRDGRPVLSLVSQSAAGEAARILLPVRPGDATLSVRGGGFAGDAATGLTLRCAQNGQAIMMRTFTPTGEDGVTVATRFSVPPACHYAWLTIEYRPGSGDIGSGAWLDSLTLSQA